MSNGTAQGTANVTEGLRKATRCLFLEVPERIASDVQVRAEAVITEHGALLAEVGRLREALKRVADQGCQIIWGGKRRGFTCLDKQQEARDFPQGFTNGFRAEVLRGDFPCVQCQARAALSGKGEGEQMTLVEAVEYIRNDEAYVAALVELREVREVLLSTARHKDGDGLPCWCVVMMRTMPHVEHCQRARDLMEKLKP